MERTRDVLSQVQGNAEDADPGMDAEKMGLLAEGLEVFNEDESQDDEGTHQTLQSRMQVLMCPACQAHNLSSIWSNFSP
jgi:hypothetical protein